MRAFSRCRRVLLALAVATCTAHGIRLARIHDAAARLPAGLAGHAAELALLIERHAVEPPPGLLAAGVLDGLAWGTGDSFTRVLDDRALAARVSGLAGQYGGLGVVIGYEERSALVEVVYANSPAAAAGLVPGDRICSVDGHPTAGIDPKDLRELLRGTPGSVVALEIWREAGARRFVATATRALVHVPSAVRAGWLDRGRGIATVALAQFQEHAADECARALTDLEATAPLRALALDLRANPGGLIGEARKVAGLFTNAPVVATVARRGALAREPIGREGPPARWPALPLVVLIDRDSASAAEILAGALADHRRALVVGERSYGKASIQDTIRLADGRALVLTVARYLTPAGQRIHRGPGVRGGIAPDMVVPLDRLGRAHVHERWREHTIAHSGVLPPGWAPRDLPDPALEVARAALAGERVAVRMARD